MTLKRKVLRDWETHVFNTRTNFLENIYLPIRILVAYIFNKNDMKDSVIYVYRLKSFLLKSFVKKKKTKRILRRDIYTYIHTYTYTYMYICNDFKSSNFPYLASWVRLTNSAEDYWSRYPAHFPTTRFFETFLLFYAGLPNEFPWYLPLSAVSKWRKERMRREFE